MVATPRLPESTRAHFARLRELGGEPYAAYLAAGYREFLCADPDAQAASHRSPFLLQKAVRRDGAKRGTRLFFVNVWVYDFSRFDREDYPPVSFQPEVQFNSTSNRDDVKGPTFDVTYLGADKSPEAVEAFFLTVYERMACGPYDDD
jgi:hypothetical protein